MRREMIVEEEINVLVRVMPSGDVRPTSFLWRDRTRYVADIGRTWEERVGGHTLHCFLIQAVDNDTYELRWNPAANAWTIHRAWLNDAIA